MLCATKEKKIKAHNNLLHGFTLIKKRYMSVPG